MVAQTKVFVGSLPPGSKPEELRRLFERFGVVTECDIMNRCGFVHMQTEDQAAAAIRELHNSTFNGGMITVEKGRIKERGGPRGGGRGGMRGSDRRGGLHAGPPRDAPYPPIRDRGMGGPIRGPPMRNGGGYDRGMDRVPMTGGYDDRYYGYGGEDRRSYAATDTRTRDPYAAPPPMYQDDRQAPMYPDERSAMDRRPPMRSAPMSAGYDTAPAPRAAPMGNGDMYSRRAEPAMRAPAVSPAYERDPYAQQYPPLGRQGYTAPADDMAAMYPDDRQAPMYPDERSAMDRRPPMRSAPMSAGYDTAPAPRAAPMGNGDMYSRRAEPAMRAPAVPPAYERDPYAQQYPPLGRYWDHPG